ncbi:MAG: hypothetical protein ABI862_00100 [Ilumatobacteraceae bacterium]
MSPPVYALVAPAQPLPRADESPLPCIIGTVDSAPIPVRHVLLDNGVLGKISKEQRAAEYDV